MSDESWKTRALCRRFPDIEFVPDPFLGQDPLPAKQVCRLCPVSAECRGYRKEHDLVGVWGGEDEVDYLLRLDVQAPATSGCSCSDDGVVIVTVMGAVCTTCGRVDE